ncbi:hypothetical protein [Streptomyces sp. NBC_01477]|uniref:hypothetical protein n=1 Tax=Streptomyces sp. NBC_01477 TaxID=2976015 RepID=UPI002E35106E|nr:hypothetical protein [Streptomyces sp. NBC_01477]
MESDRTRDTAAEARRARFGSLPARIRREDMIEEQRTGSKDPAGDGYSPERSWASFSCLALDLGL